MNMSFFILLNIVFPTYFCVIKYAHFKSNRKFINLKKTIYIQKMNRERCGK